MELSANPRRNAVFTTLVADADLYFDSFLGEFLKAEDHFILRASTAAQTLAMTREYMPDLILLDNDLEGCAGISLMAELLLEHSGSAVVVMASKASIFEAVEAMKLGAADYLERPLNTIRLKQAIDLQKDLFLLA
jgi:two-component system nitrogen regulation response regulator GlnG